VNGSFGFGRMGSNPTWNSDATEGNFIDLSPTLSYVNCGDLSDSLSNAITVMVRFQGYASTQGKQIVGQSVTGGTTSDWRFYWQGSVDRVGFFITNASGTEVGDTHTNVLSLNTWYTYTGTYDGDSVAVWHNGADEEKTDHSGNIRDSNYNTYMGANRNSGDSFNGGISFLFIWNRVLSDAEIRSYSQNPYIGFYSRRHGAKRIIYYD